MADEALSPEFPASLRVLIRQLGAGTLDVRRVVFFEPGLLPATLNTEAEELCRDRNAARSALCDLLPDEHPPTAHTFYSRLQEFSVLLINCPSKDELLGTLISESFRQWDAVGEELLHGLNNNEHNAFFAALGGLPTFLSENEISVEFAATWFVEILERLGNDQISGGFWNGLKAFAHHFPKRALDVAAFLFREYKPRENALSVAATLLGVCRGATTTGEVPDVLMALDDEFKNSRRPIVRIYFQRSWIPTANERELIVRELEALIASMNEGTKDEYINAFQVVSSCLRSKMTGAVARKIGLEWLRRQASSTLPPLAKHHIIGFAAEQSTTDLDDLLLAVQPISPEHGGTWNSLIQILVQRLQNRGQEAFKQLLTSMAEAGGRVFIKGFSSSDMSSLIVSVLSNQDSSNILADLLFSVRPLLRGLGFFFLEKLPTPAITAEVLAGKTDTELLLSLFELRGSALVTRGQTIADYLLVVAPRMEQAGAELQVEFEDEIFIQAKNFPGACLERFKVAAAGGFILVAKAVAKAEAYFQALRVAQGSPLTAMHVPGMDRAYRHHARQFSHAVHKQSQEKSVLAQLFKTVHLLYGDQFAFNQGGALEAQPFQQMSVEMEVPRLEFIDPELMLLRRLTAKMEIARIQHSLADQSAPPQSGQTV